MKYIDADKLKEKINSFMDSLWKVLPNASNVELGNLSIREVSDLGAYKALEGVLQDITSLQQEQLPGIEESGIPGKDFTPVEWVDACEKYGKWKIVKQEQPNNIVVPRWCLKSIEDTLRIQYDINLDKKTGETCQDRNIKEALNGVRKLLKGEELTGGERLEKLQPSLPSNLDEAAEQIASDIAPTHPDIGWDECFEKIKEGIKAGAGWMAGQFEKYSVAPEGAWIDRDGNCFTHTLDADDPIPVDNPGGAFDIYIRKK